MSIDITNNSEQLRKICEDYFQQQITRNEYLAQRKIIFDEVEQKMNTGISTPLEVSSGAVAKENLVDKLTALLKD